MCDTLARKRKCRWGQLLFSMEPSRRIKPCPVKSPKRDSVGDSEEKSKPLRDEGDAGWDLS